MSTPAEIRAWFTANEGTPQAAQAATRAVTAILGLHHEALVRYHDDSQPVCAEDGQDYDGIDLPGCRTTRAIANEIRHVLAGDAIAAPVSSSEDTPAPIEQQWAVRHPNVSLSVHRSPHSVLYTASKLPGGVIVTRASDQDEWAVETDCLCGSTKPTDRHYEACPGATPAPRVWHHDDDEPEEIGLQLQYPHGPVFTYVGEPARWPWKADGVVADWATLHGTHGLPLVEVPAGGEPA